MKTNTIRHLPFLTSVRLLCSAILVVTASPLRGQIVADGATTNLINVTNTITGDVTVGTNGSFTLLVLSDNALLTNSVNGVIGRNATAKSNEVQLVSATARWFMGGSLFVGNNGAANRLVVSNGATVLAGNSSTIGSGPDLSGNAFSNTVTVSGVGSLWSSGLELVVGDVGTANRLEVNNGGRVVNSNAFVGRSFFSPSNTVLVTGTGSLWSNRADVSLGGSGSGNLLVVSNGGWVVNSNASVGVLGLGNLALVTGTNSTWSNRADLYVGNGGRANQLVVSDGGLVVDNNGVLGNSVTSSNNFVLVTGSGSVWSNRADLDVGLSGAGNQLVVTNGGVVRNNFGILGVNSGSSNNVALVAGFGSVWTNANDVYVGRSGAGNQLLVSDGGLVRNNDGYLGVNAGSSNNLAVVTGLGSVWSNAGALFLGQDDQGNRLVVTNEGVVRSSSVFIGLNTGSSNNVAVVTGSGSMWTNAQDFYAGYSGAANLLIVSNGGFVQNGSGFNRFLGYASSSSNNLAVVTGSGSVWSNSLGTLFVGRAGSGNQLVVSNAGRVDTGVALLSGFAVSSNNLALITGPGSRLRMLNGGIFVGDIGAGNRMVVSNGGSVENFEGIIGTTTFSSNNEALVTGAGSTWTNQSLDIGYSGSGNRLTITNGGQAYALFITVGQDPSSTNNRVVVDGGTLRASYFSGIGLLDVRRGTNVLNAGLIDADQLFMTNTLGKFEFNGGTLITRGALITDIVPFVVGVAGTNPAVWDVRAGVSNHVVTVPLILGQFSSFNQLLVTNGALFTSAGGFLGLNSNARSNTAIVAGPGSTWSNSATFEIGSGAPFNSLIVSNGGFVRNTIGTLGQSGGGNNLALVTGAGSVWSNANNLVVGSLGSSNQLLVLDGGTVKVPFAGVGSFASSNNLVVVAGSNSLWHTLTDLSFGSDGVGNQLVVSNGGRVWGLSAELGQFSAASNNVALVTGPGSAWTNVNLTVGGAGRGNQLIVNNGGAVRSGTTMLGSDPVGSNNVALVTDTGSEMNGELYVGFFGSRHQLVVSNGAVAQGSYGALGFFASSSNNLAVVTGSGSVWSNALELSVGLFGRGNQLVVSNGAMVASGLGFTGRETNANRNSAIVTGPGTSWLLASNLYVGSNGAFNQLIITNGAFARNEQGFIGTGASSSNNLALVTGPGSVWSNAGDFFVGSSGAGNQLVVSNGALLLSSSNAWLGFAATSRSNVALVTGAGTTWSNGQTLLVGESGSGNRLTVSDGARIESKFGWIGQLTSASNNEMVVTGPDSSWRTEQDLNLGGLGSGNRLVITNGGSVLNNGGAGIGTAMSSSNEVVVTGTGSSWTLGSTLFVGQVASGCRLMISNGGAVFQNSVGGLIVGSVSSSTNNRIQVDGGTLLVTNAVSSKFDVRRGMTVLNAGLIEVAQFLLTNGQGFLQFNGGTFSTRSSTVGNGTIFGVGDGVSPATFILAGNGLHEFNALLVARVNSNATFTGNGTITGPSPLQFLAGSRLVPGTSVGKMVFSNSPALHGAVFMEISKNGATLTNDQIQVIAPLTYGGSLIVSNLGPTALAAGDRFPLFSASSYTGGFTNIILPPLPPGLGWTNKLSVDGSIEVASGPQFTSVTLSGTNVIISGTNGPPNALYAVLTATNVVTPLSNWVSLVTNQFDSSGNFSFTNGIAPGIPQRFFRIRTP